MKKEFNVAAVIMAGGKSRRMNEKNKAFLKINGKTIISYVLETIYKQTNNIVINTNRDTKKFKSLGFDVVSDSIKNYAGPLAGILSGMDWLKELDTGIEWLFSAPTDAPFLPDNIVNKLYLNSLDTNSLISVAKSRGRVHPVCAVWHLSLIDKLRSSINNGVRKVDRFTVDFSPSEVEFDGEIDPFFNINTPEDLNIAENYF